MHITILDGFIRTGPCDYSGWEVQQEVVCSLEMLACCYRDNNFKRLRRLFEEWYNPYFKVESLRMHVEPCDVLESKTEDKYILSLRWKEKPGGWRRFIDCDFFLSRLLSRRWYQQTPRIAHPYLVHTSSFTNLYWKYLHRYPKTEHLLGPKLSLSRQVAT